MSGTRGMKWSGRDLDPLTGHLPAVLPEHHDWEDPKTGHFPVDAHFDTRSCNVFCVRTMAYLAGYKSVLYFEKVIIPSLPDHGFHLPRVHYSGPLSEKPVIIYAGHDQDFVDLGQRLKRERGRWPSQMQAVANPLGSGLTGGNAPQAFMEPVRIGPEGDAPYEIDSSEKARHRRG